MKKLISWAIFALFAFAFVGQAASEPGERVAGPPVSGDRWLCTNCDFGPYNRTTNEGRVVQWR